MLRRTIGPPILLGTDRFGDDLASTRRYGRRLSLWFGELLLIAIVIFGFVMLIIGNLLGTASAAPERVALKGHTQVVEALAFSPDGGCSRPAAGTIPCESGI